MNTLKILLKVHEVLLQGHILDQSNSELNYNYMSAGIGLYH